MRGVRTHMRLPSFTTGLTLITSTSRRVLIPSVHKFWGDNTDPAIRDGDLLGELTANAFVNLQRDSVQPFDKFCLLAVM